MTKPIAAAATMILIEEGKVRLGDPVDQLLPELGDRRVLQRLDGPLDDTVPANRPITVRDLLTFRMGFGTVMRPADAGYGTSWSSDSKEDLLGILMTQRLVGSQSARVDLDFWTTVYQAIDD
jgi:CubicO group peptidase (beta-lactamase class C family)